MILLQFDKEEQICFENTFNDKIYEKGYIESKNLGGGEILLQAIITSVSIAAPYIIDFFRKQRAENKQIKIIKNGVQMTFDNEEALKKFLNESITD